MHHLFPESSMLHQFKLAITNTFLLVFSIARFVWMLCNFAFSLSLSLFRYKSINFRNYETFCWQQSTSKVIYLQLWAKPLLRHSLSSNFNFMQFLHSQTHLFSSSFLLLLWAAIGIFRSDKPGFGVWYGFSFKRRQLLVKSPIQKPNAMICRHLSYWQTTFLMRLDNFFVLTSVSSKLSLCFIVFRLSVKIHLQLA